MTLTISGLYWKTIACGLGAFFNCVLAYEAWLSGWRLKFLISSATFVLMVYVTFDLVGELPADMPGQISQALQKLAN
jgi:hypothetical protein